MSGVRYVILDPTGNLTALVTEKPSGADEREITRRLMAESEQVAYLEPPTLPGSRARIRLMGGEFCGNAAMACACYLAEREGIRPGEERHVPLEMSGMAGVMDCLVRAEGDGYTGAVPMPRVLEIIHPYEKDASLTAVRLEGITHLIREGTPFADRKEAEAFLLRQAELRPGDGALGLLQWEEQTLRMTPLVYVRDSGTLVWETGCGSGSAAIGAWRAWKQGGGTVTTPVRQPGGVIQVCAGGNGGLPDAVSITGRVRIGEERFCDNL